MTFVYWGIGLLGLMGLLVLLPRPSTFALTMSILNMFAVAPLVAIFVGMHLAGFSQLKSMGMAVIFYSICVWGILAIMFLARLTVARIKNISVWAQFESEFPAPDVNRRFGFLSIQLLTLGPSLYLVYLAVVGLGFVGQVLTGR